MEGQGQAQAGSQEPECQVRLFAQPYGCGAKAGVEKGENDKPGQEPERRKDSLGPLPEKPPGDLPGNHGQDHDPRNPQHDLGKRHLDSMDLERELKDQGGQDRGEDARKDGDEKSQLLVASCDEVMARAEARVPACAARIIIASRKNAPADSGPLISGPQAFASA